MLSFCYVKRILTMFVYYNPNPEKKLVGDCVIRAISKLTNQTWDNTFKEITLKAFEMRDMPSSNEVWSAYLKDKDFQRFIIPDTCPDCYSVIDFADDHPKGLFMLATGTHVIAVQDGDYFDTWDSGNEIPIYYWRKR